jgi:hypothetical protein
VRDHHAHVAALLALETHAVGRDVRLAADQQGRDDLQQLAPVDRAAVQLEVDVHVRRDRGDVARVEI